MSKFTRLHCSLASLIVLLLIATAISSTTLPARAQAEADGFIHPDFRISV